MKQRKKRPVPPPPPIVADDTKKKEDQEEMPPMELMSPMVDSDDIEYRKRHRLAQELQLRTAEEGYVLLKNSGILPLNGAPVRINVFGRHAGLFFDAEKSRKFGIEVNEKLLAAYTTYKIKDACYTGSGWDEENNCSVPQHRTATGMFGGMGYLDPEPYIGFDVVEDGTVRVKRLPEELLEQAKAFSDTAAVVLYRHGGEGADHEKGDENLSEGEAAMLSFCTENFEKVIVILATNSVIDGGFLVEDTVQKFYKYTYGGGVYSNNIGNEVLADFDSRVEILYQDENGDQAPHCYPIRADCIGGVFYTCNNPGDRGLEALSGLLTGNVNPSGRLMDEIVYDYDDNPVSRCSGGLVFSKESTGKTPYIYGHNYVAYKEGVYLGYKYFETFCPERVVYPFGFGLSYTDFSWHVGALQTGKNEYGELCFSVEVKVTNTGARPGREVVELYVTPPYDAESGYHVEKPLVSLAAFQKTILLPPGGSQTVNLSWNARDVASYSDTAECYVLEKGTYQFCVATNAGTAHSAPAASLPWKLEEDMRFTHDEVTGTPYRNLFTGSETAGWRFDARGTEKEHIVYLHRIDVDGKPTVAPGTYPEYPVLDERTRETAQILDLETRGLDSYYEMDGTDVHFYAEDIPVPTTNAVYRDENGNRRNFMLQDVNRYLKDKTSSLYHNAQSLSKEIGVTVPEWNKEAEELVWKHFLEQFSVSEMLCRFYHCGFDIPALPEYGIPVTYSADTPGQIGANNKMKMFRTTKYCDTILACTFDQNLCYEFGLALAREAAASGENGTSYFYAPGSNLHRSCLSGKNNNYFSEDAYLSGQACGHFLKGLEEGGVNGCLKHFACNDQEISREGLVVFSNEQALRELYFAAFEHAIKIGGGQGIMTSLGRVGTVNACGNEHLTRDLLRKEWGFDGMLITDGYGVTSYMYNINAMLGASSGLLCFGNSGNFGQCRDYMELYRYYLQYPGRTTAALQEFMKGCMHSLLQSHTFRDLYQDYDYYESADAEQSADINWFEAQIGLGYRYRQADTLTYCGIQLRDGESNPPGMMPNTNCKNRGGTIAQDDYGLAPATCKGKTGETVAIPVSVEKCAGMSEFGFDICYDTGALKFASVSMENSILKQENYLYQMDEIPGGVRVQFRSLGNVFSRPCGELFTLNLSIQENAGAGEYAVKLLPMTNESGALLGSFFDKQHHEMSFSLNAKAEKGSMTGGWSGVYQSVESSEWWNALQKSEEDNDLADLTLLSGSVLVSELN